jgi:predicted nucleic acid-binding protein
LRAVANVDLASYDGGAGFLVDSNVWIDCMDPASPWHDWAVDYLQGCSERAPLHVNLIIYTELLVPEPDIEALDAMLDVFETQRSAMPWSCAGLAAKAFNVYRRRGGVRHSPLPDFFIGAHAAISNFTVLTRDPKPYRSHYPRLALVAAQ